MNSDLERDTSLDIREAIDKSTLNHGDVVNLADGSRGIVIDSQEEMRRQTEIPEVEQTRDYIAELNNYLNGMDAQIDQAKRDAMKRQQAATEQKDVMRNINPDSQLAMELKKVQKEFDKVDMTANGLAPIGSPEVEDYNRKQQMLMSGQVDLSNIKYEGYYQFHPADNDVPHAETTPEPTTDTSVVEFNVPENNVKNFISTLDNEDRNKVERSSKIIVNEVLLKDIPTATRRITSLDEYRRVVPKKINNVIECALPNSGYYAYFKGCGSLAMASIIPDLNTEEIDYAKRYQFLYDNLVTTSIGKMSYQEFCNRTSVKDLEIGIYTVLRASDPDDNEIVLTCGDERCMKDYTINYKLSELMDVESISDEMTEALSKIVAAKDIEEEAQKIHEESPVMTAKYAQFETSSGTVIFVLKNINGSTIIDRMPKIKEIEEKYDRLMTAFLLYIPSMYITFTMEGETKPSTYHVTDPFAIIEEIRNLSTAQTHALGQILDGLVEYNPPRFHFKGKHVCPHCKRVEYNTPCSVDSIVFYKVGQAIR